MEVSPVKADPFFGHCELAGADLQRTRVYLELGALAPETAGRITVNGNSVGGFIGKPARVEIGKHLKAGPNTFCIAPFAPEAVRLVICPMLSQ